MQWKQRYLAAQQNMVLVEYLVTDLTLKYFYSFKVDFTSKSQHIVNLHSFLWQQLKARTWRNKLTRMLSQINNIPIF